MVAHAQNDTHFEQWLPQQRDAAAIAGTILVAGFRSWIKMARLAVYLLIALDVVGYTFVCVLANAT